MNGAQLQSTRLDLGPVVEAIARELDGTVAAERIETLVRDLLERDFSDARITAYVPIFLRRAASETLRRELQSQVGAVRESEPLAG